MAAPQQTIVVQAVPAMPANYNPEAESIKSMTGIAGIFGIIMAVLALLGALWEIWVYVTWTSVVAYYDVYGNAVYNSGWALGFLIWAIVLFVFFALGILFYMNCKKIKDMVNQGRYIEAKSKALIWMIIGIIFVFFIPGILLLIAYLKFDPLIRGTQGMGGQVIVVQQPGVVQAQPNMVVQQPTMVQPQPMVVAQQPITVQPSEAGFVFCMACGTKNAGAAMFCQKCGNKLK